MSDIFISYARADRFRVKPLVDVLVQQGWSVWWDPHIPTGKTFASVIEQELSEAACVIVLWSAASIKSNWVMAEAEEARQRGRLLPVLLDDIKPPLAFRLIQTASLVTWPGELDQLLKATAALVPVHTTTPPSTDERKTPSSWRVVRHLDGISRTVIWTGLGALAGLVILLWIGLLFTHFGTLPDAKPPKQRSMEQAGSEERVAKSELKKFFSGCLKATGFMKIPIRERELIRIAAHIDTRCGARGWSPDGGQTWAGPNGIDGRYVPDTALPWFPYGALIGGFACDDNHGGEECHGHDFSQVENAWDQVHGTGSRQLVGHSKDVGGIVNGFFYLVINGAKASLGRNIGGLWVDVNISPPD